MGLILTNNHIAAFFIALFILSIAVISFATKGMMIQAEPSLKVAELIMPEVYRAAEGLICIDAILALYCILFMLSLFRSHPGVLTIFQIFLLLVLIGRFVLGVTFLAGNDNYLADIVKNYDEKDEYERSWMDFDTRNRVVTMKAAWVFEIIAICLSNILAPLLLLVQNKIKAGLKHDHEMVPQGH